LSEADCTPLCFEPATFRIEVFDLGGESGIELLAGVVSSGFDFTGLALDRSKLGLLASEVDASCVDFFKDC
jgi:hypothetical protein